MDQITAIKKSIEHWDRMYERIRRRAEAAIPIGGAMQVSGRSLGKNITLTLDEQEKAVAREIKQEAVRQEDERRHQSHFLHWKFDLDAALPNKKALSTESRRGWIEKIMRSASRKARILMMPPAEAFASLLDSVKADIKAGVDPEQIFKEFEE